MGAKTTEEIKKFWDAEAIRYGDDKIGAHSDPHIVELENWFVIERCLRKFKPATLLDIGSGNGQRTKLFSEYVTGDVVGTDYSSNMIGLAKKLENKKLHFKVADILDKESVKNLSGPFDCIVSCRCLINLATTDNQLMAIDHIFELLNEGGTFVFCEGSRQGTESLNTLRKLLNLEPIKTIPQNLDLDEPVILNHLERKRLLILDRSRLGLYYMLTRVYYPGAILPEQPNPRSQFNSVAARLAMKIEGDAFSDAGRHLCVVCRKSP